ncbi:hypothetical protein [Anabaena sphaerica]|nr:hypothetical protein [Anabaena sphaerica]
MKISSNRTPSPPIPPTPHKAPQGALSIFATHGVDGGIKSL